MKSQERDEELEKRLEMFDGWVKEGKIPRSSKVIPITQSVAALQWVLPTQQMIELLRNSRSFALANCACRTKHKQCNNPLEVCFYTNDVADKKVAQGDARHVSMEEATDVLKLANEYGLVHLTIYNPEQHIYALCSCCECCCHDIAFMKKLGRPDLVAHADYIAVIDKDQCTQCGVCTERCVFGAWVIKKGEVIYDNKKCYGCGLCVTKCPDNAIKMELRTPAA